MGREIELGPCRVICLVPALQELHHHKVCLHHLQELLDLENIKRLKYSNIVLEERKKGEKRMKKRKMRERKELLFYFGYLCSDAGQ